MLGAKNPYTTNLHLIPEAETWGKSWARRRDYAGDLFSLILRWDVWWLSEKWKKLLVNSCWMPDLRRHQKSWVRWPGYTFHKERIEINDFLTHGSCSWIAREAYIIDNIWTSFPHLKRLSGSIVSLNWSRQSSLSCCEAVTMVGRNSLSGSISISVTLTLFAINAYLQGNLIDAALSNQNSRRRLIICAE